MKPIFTGLLLILLALPGFSQQEGEELDGPFQGEILEEGDLFEEQIVEEEGEAEAEAATPEEAFLVSEQVELGGFFELLFDTTVLWDGYPDSWDTLVDPLDTVLATRVAADLFFDARPQRDFRVFGKVKAAYEYQPAAGSYDWDVEIFELFADFQYRDLLFFRAGKQTVQWGVGYFFSPGDVLSLVSIDPENPEAEREGPVAFKTHFPFGAHNSYLYLVANDVEKPSEIAAAPKVEVLMGNYELGIGAFYQKNLAPKGTLTLTGPLWEFDLFGEAMIQWGSDSAPIEDRLLFSATAGCAYFNPIWDITVVSQYLFDDQAGAGQHSLAAGVSWFELLDSRFTLSVLYLANLSDGSGVIMPDITWAPIDQLSITTGPQIGYGSGGDQYGPGSLAWVITVSAGGPF